jgi:hypothetical protein
VSLCLCGGTPLYGTIRASSACFTAAIPSNARVGESVRGLRGEAGLAPRP